MYILKTTFYNQFSCIADRCSYNCCQDWSIDIDPITYNKYKKIDSINALCIPSSEDASAKICMTDSGKCPFLDDKGLCKLVVGYGEEALSLTCTVFPRMRLRRDDVEEQSVSNACPAVLDILNRLEEPISFVFDEMEEEKAGYTCTQCTESLVPCRDLIIDLLQVQEFPLWFRLYIVFSFIKNIKEDNSDMQACIERFSNPEYLLEIYAQILVVEKNEQYKLYEAIKLFTIFTPETSFKKHGLFIKYMKPIKEKLTGCNLEQLIADWQEFERIWAQKESFYENVCVNYIFCNALKKGDMTSFCQSVSGLFVEVILARIAPFLHWVFNGKSISEEELFDIITFFARRIEHNNDIYQDIDLLEQDGWFEMGKMFSLLR